MPVPGKYLLLVEDLSDDQELALLALGAACTPVPVEIVRDGEAALEFLLAAGRSSARERAALPVVVLLDLKLPKVDGLETLRRLRAERRTQSLPVVILSSSKSDLDLRESYRLGANSYVRKPVDFHEFRATLQFIGRYWVEVNESPPQGWKTPIPGTPPAR
ncbi:MAG: response regulator [Planctomycetes bacterium]|nr:response regulator [Planctomycetota bacterium]